MVKMWDEFFLATNLHKTQENPAINYVYSTLFSLDRENKQKDRRMTWK